MTARSRSESSRPAARPTSLPGAVLRRGLRGSALLLAALALGACVAQVRNHGYLPSDAQLSEIVIGVDSRETVSDLVGSPTTAGVLSGGNFYYVGDTTRTIAWRAPEVVQREIVEITFDEAGVAQNITRYGLEDGRVVPITRRVTETTDGDIGFIRRLFGNIGGIDAGSVLDQ